LHQFEAFEFGRLSALDWPSPDPAAVGYQGQVVVSGSMWTNQRFTRVVDCARVWQLVGGTAHERLSETQSSDVGDAVEQLSQVERSAVQLLSRCIIDIHFFLFHLCLA
jgi:hypothetical protein